MTIFGSFWLLIIINDTKAQTKEQILKSIIADTSKQAKTLIRTLNDLKSGNWQDVLTSFFQIGISDLSGSNRAYPAFNSG